MPIPESILRIFIENRPVAACTPLAWLRIRGTPLKRCANPEEIEEFTNALMAV